MHLPVLSIQRRGFTLVELLVVLVVIGILAVLSAPALGRTRDRAKEAICLNNFRQSGIGMKLYQSDNQGRYPLGGTLIANPGAVIPRSTPREQL